MKFEDFSKSRRFDSSGDGQLSFHEFVAALAIMIRGTEEKGNQGIGQEKICFETLWYQ